jgi:hypothetical protein
MNGRVKKTLTMEPVITGGNKEFIISCMDKKQKEILSYTKLQPAPWGEKKYCRYLDGGI